MNEYVEFPKRKLALVLVDIQRKFIETTDGLKVSMMGKVDTVNQAIDLFRSTGNPVIYIMFDGLGSCIREVEDGDELVPGLREPRDGEPVLHKTAMNAFNGTGLESILKDMGCDGIVLAGLVAHMCVAASYYGAHDVDIMASMLDGGIAATDEENVEHVLSICNKVTLDDIRGNVHFI
ncbi:MAG: cysteine hydrolase [Candidatus Methanomethylophilaceae archaeon]|nr:cysteine hydrolase [Candidatus Methanomethylophilaceae archaeon]